MPEWLQITIIIVSIFFGSGGFITGIIAFIKARPEVKKIEADTTQIVISGSIEVQSKLLEQLKQIIAIVKEEREAKEAVIKERDECFDKLNA